MKCILFPEYIQNKIYKSLDLTDFVILRSFESNFKLGFIPSLKLRC